MSKRKIIYPDQSEIKKLEELIKENFTEIVNSRVKDLLQQSKCPFTTALDMLHKSKQKNSYKFSICRIVTENLSPYNTEINSASEEVKKQVAYLISRFNKRLRKLLYESFRLDQLDKFFVEKMTKKHLDNKKIRNFLAYHSLFNLHDDETTEKVFIPMLAKGRYFNDVLKYADNSKKTQTRVLRFVGRLICELNSNTSTAEEQELVERLLLFLETAKERYPTAYSEVKIQNSEVKCYDDKAKIQSFEVMPQNSTDKTQNNKVKSQNSEANVDKNEEKNQMSNENLKDSEAKIQNSEATGVKKMQKSSKSIKKGQSWKTLLHIKYLLKQWKNKQISGSSLEYLIFRYVENDPDLVEKVARLVENKYKDIKKADLLRQSMQSGNWETPVWRDEREIPIGDHELKLAIPFENVIMVDSEEKLNDCFDYFKNNKPSNGSLLPVGFDAEWITSTINVRLVDLAVIQFAVNDRVFLIDFVYFQQNSIQLLTEFIKHVFQSDAFIILGFGVSEDKRVLKRYFKDALWTADTHLMDFLKSRNSKMFSKRATDFEFCPNTEKELKGLSKLCYRVSMCFLFK